MKRSGRGVFQGEEILCKGRDGGPGPDMLVSQEARVAGAEAGGR